MGDSCSKLSSVGVGGAAGTVGTAGNFGSLATVTTITAMAGPPSYRTAKRIRTKAVPASYTSGSGSANKSASFTQLPEGNISFFFYYLNQLLIDVKRHRNENTSEHLQSAKLRD